MHNVHMGTSCTQEMVPNFQSDRIWNDEDLGPFWRESSQQEQEQEELQDE